MTHLGSDAAAPLRDDEYAQIAECITPVPKDAGEPTFKRDGRAPDCRYAYLDAAGRTLGYVLRWNAHDGADKEFRPATFWRNGKTKGTWRAKSWPSLRPLFGLDQLAAHPDAIVLLVEGEKAAEAVEYGPLAHEFTWQERKIIGVSWPGGTNALARVDFAPLAGRDVVVAPDNDEAGEKAADVLIGVLQKVGVKKLRRWRPPAQLPAKWDIADDVPEGLTPEALARCILEAPEVSTPHLVLTLSEFLAQFEPPHYLVDGLLQHHCLYSLTGKTGSGKTSVAVLLAVLVASKSGGQLAPHAVEPGRVVYIAAENPLDVQMRFMGITAKQRIDPHELDLLVIGNIKNLDEELPRITREIEAFGEVNLVIVDTAPSLFPGNDENDNVQSRDHAKRLRKLTELPGKPCVLPLCHPVKNASASDSLLPRGGGAFLNEMDGNLTIWLHDGNLTDLHWTGKFRGPDFDKITFRLETVYSTTLVDRKGRVLPTVVAAVVTEAEAAASEQAAVAQEDQLLIAMHNRPRGTLLQWASDCRWFVAGDPLKPNKFAVHRVVKRLEKLKLVAKEGRDHVLTKTGKAAAKKALPPEPKA